MENGLDMDYTSTSSNVTSMAGSIVVALKGSSTRIANCTVLKLVEGEALTNTNPTKPEG